MMTAELKDEAGNVRHLNLEQVVEVVCFKEACYEDKRKADDRAFEEAKNISSPYLFTSTYERIYDKMIREDYPQIDKTRLIFSNGTEIILEGTYDFARPMENPQPSGYNRIR